MKITFVGIHNKPDMMPLDSLTKSGKVIDKIIKHFPDAQCIKANLFDLDRMPLREEKSTLKMDFLNRHDCENTDDIFVLLGSMVHREMPFIYSKHVEVPHPAYWGGSVPVDQYVNMVVAKIKEAIQ